MSVGKSYENCIDFQKERALHKERCGVLRLQLMCALSIFHSYVRDRQNIYFRLVLLKLYSRSTLATYTFFQDGRQRRKQAKSGVRDTGRSQYEIYNNQLQCGVHFRSVEQKAVKKQSFLRFNLFCNHYVHLARTFYW